MRSQIAKIAEIFKTECKKESCRKVGIEVERIAFTQEGKSLGYSAPPEKPSAEKLLNELFRKYGWPKILSGTGKIIGLSSPPGKVSLEPGSQVEFSSEPLKSLHDVQKVLAEFETAVDDITCDWGLGWSSLGLNPVESPEEKSIIASPRYHIMTDYLPTKGSLGLAMMRLSTSVQINLDYTSEDEGIEMLRVALLVAPLSYALFANSPIYQRKKTEFLSFRGNIWLHMDPDRSGLLESAFSHDFSFLKYSEMLYQLPLMYAENSRGEYVPARGQSLADIHRGTISDVSVSDENCMGAVRQLFTEARLKPGYVEIRSVDGQSAEYRYAATAFWMGLLYSQEARQLVLSELGSLSSEKKAQWFFDCISHGLASQIDGRPTRTLAEKLVEAAEAGLRRRGEKEEKYLVPLKRNVAQGINPANIINRLYEENCHEDLGCLLRSSQRCCDSQP